MSKMFNTKEKEEGGVIDNMQTVLGDGIKIEGTFSGSGNITIHGAVVGTLQTSGDLMVKTTARIEANVEANNITLAGEVKGNVVCHGQLQLLNTGKIFGDVTAESISVETGAILEGNCSAGKQISAKVASPEKNSEPH